MYATQNIYSAVGIFLFQPNESGFMMGDITTDAIAKGDLPQCQVRAVKIINKSNETSK